MSSECSFHDFINANIFSSKILLFLASSVLAICASDARGQRYSFDAAMLGGDQKNIDLSIFEEGAQLPGIYPVAVILNGEQIDSRDISFNIERDENNKPSLKACLTQEMLVKYGVKVDEYPGLFLKSKAGREKEKICADLNAIPQSTESFLFGRQQLLLSIPQVALRPKLTGIAPESLWDDGIPAFLVNWQANASRAEYRDIGNENSNFWANLEPGLNFGPWRIRNLTTWNKQSGQPGKWDTVYSRAERGINSLKSRLVIGEDYTPSDIFDSVPFRGVMLGSDENMVPYNQREFAPVVRGIAHTQARVEVRQDGFLIQSQTVAPGAFAITDIPATGSGGDLQVIVLESDGTRQVFTVPYTTPAIALREGYLKYNVTGGQYRSSDSAIAHSNVGQITAMYGLPGGLTMFGGIQSAEHYQAEALGFGLAMGRLGAVSVDAIHSQGQKKGQNSEKGDTWRIRYSKLFEATGTSFSAASYLYSSNGYNTLSEVLDTYRDGENYTGDNNEGRNRRTTLTLGQSFRRWGSLNLNASRDEYRDGKPHKDSISTSYSVSWRDISWTLNWTRNQNTNRGNFWRTEDNFSLWMSVPLRRWLGGTENNVRAMTQIQTASGGRTQYELGLNGRAFDRRLYWDVREQMGAGDNTHNKNSSRLHMTWNGTYGELTGIYSYNSHIRQMNAGISGGMIVHSNGVTFGQRIGETTALVEAPGVAGAAVGGWSGVRTDFRGYTIWGYAQPYQENVVALDPTTFSADAEVPQTDSRVVPTKGAVVRAKFETHIGKRALLTITRKDGTPLPFGSVVTVSSESGKQSDSGVMGERGEVYMSGLSDTGRLVVQWGKHNRCYADYRLPKQTGPAGVFLTRSVCM
ncbi:fimbria/pilus outer membrane usher protein [Escherichia coli]|nr:fimbria/pilus outer membrane usher protein [Escherichia coli]ELJ4115023.1 fimbria/pilus outer membrane usher protein [Escherichia coli]ELS8141214.1 fimbria/pilus outer membrane usher protein [Escherichia coli]ELT9943247.1 fimbria/pilus outer membrane usher protein [Escherichia coli]